MATWYFVDNGHRKGPVSIDEIATLVKVGTVHADTMVWSADKGGEWTAARTHAELSAFGFVAVPPPPTPRPAWSGVDVPSVVPANIDEATKRRYASEASQYTTQGTQSLFTWYWICAGPGILVCLGPIAATVLSCVLLYRHWKRLQDGHARTTPGVAVGFLFIPLFNLYWQFVAVHGLAKDMNAYLQRHRIPAQQVNENLALATCILSCVSIIPYLGVPAFIAAYVLTIFVHKDLKDADIAIQNHRSANPSAA